ncbi:hypothetical protein XBI1_2260030 [Xenorhabdus bovienii str. Intermedium]|uniref:Uncharacterized protein n=1 Tax=Xenorhabdus bovienii str. Intermedium TaxID=1379677 RepID=A0A077QHB0_XENBV|nr:hypothetical protein XBI1_2260030 [Xenorhabdus bovienii str. Intermedium]
MFVMPTAASYLVFSVHTEITRMRHMIFMQINSVLRTYGDYPQQNL